MEASPRYQETHNQNQTLLPSPTSHSTNSSTSSSSNSSNTATKNHHHPPPPTTPTAAQQTRPLTRSESANPYPTTFVQADTSSFKQVVQMLTGSSETAKLASSAKPTAHHNNLQNEVYPKTHNIPPIKSIPKKQNSGFKLYERRNSLKNLKINPLNPIFAPNNSGFSPRKPEILSPSILDFPALVLSPVTPLIPDPFDRSGAANYSGNNCCFVNNNQGSNNGNNGNLDTDAEEKAIKEKGFYLHPSPASTPRDSEPRLLPLFPVTSPRISGSSTSTTS
ncbi:VQ motif-containing protein 4-like [Carica papaya]|uniref:VQ motif-containing protein 4-like n=1 Tax=Carica papaya TaxID=3649 RepID=UPI000B8CC365|nr:VQ motif-containing protein 4-like [Carica papaya]